MPGSLPRGRGPQTWRGRRGSCRDQSLHPAGHTSPRRSTRTRRQQTSKYNICWILSNIGIIKKAPSSCSVVDWCDLDDRHDVSPVVALATMSSQLTSEDRTNTYIRSVLPHVSTFNGEISFFLLTTAVSIYYIRYCHTWCSLYYLLKLRIVDLCSQEFDQTGHNGSDQVSGSWVHIFSYHIPHILQHSSVTKIAFQISILK